MPHPQQRHLSCLRFILACVQTYPLVCTQAFSFSQLLLTYLLRKGSINETAAWLAQLAERRSAGRSEVAGSNPGRTNTQGL